MLKKYLRDVNMFFIRKQSNVKSEFFKYKDPFLSELDIKKRLSLKYKDELRELTKYKPNFNIIKKLCLKFKNKKNIIIIGNGGSITTIKAVLGFYEYNKNFIVLDTQDPDFVNEVLSLNKKDTLVVAISKSGKTLSVIELSLIFKDFDMIVISSKQGILYETLKDINKNFDFVEHPKIGGRFTAGTELTYLVLGLIGQDYIKFDKQLRKAYNSFLKNIELSIPFDIARFILYHYKKGKNKKNCKSRDKLFLPIYSQRLSSLIPLITQLFHETCGKDNFSLIVFSDKAPEFQHHTNQRVFGCDHDVILGFIKLKDYKKLKIKINQKKNKNIKEKIFYKLNGKDLSELMLFELEGVKKHAFKSKIPFFELTIEELPSFIALLHLTVIFLAEMLKLNPFNQPDVEFSKEETRKLIL